MILSSCSRSLRSLRIVCAKSIVVEFEIRPALSTKSSRLHTRKAAVRLWQLYFSALFRSGSRALRAFKTFKDYAVQAKAPSMPPSFELYITPERVYIIPPFRG
jgi:hypothetical protein